MPLKFLLGQHSDHLGITKKQSIFYMLLLSISGLSNLLILYFFYSTFTLFLTIIITILLSVLASLWLRNKFIDFSKKIQKGKLLSKRFQNISKYFESILQDSTDIIFSVDTDGYVLKFNNGAQHRFAYSQEEIVGKPLSFLFVNDKDEEKILSSVLRYGKAVNEETPMITKDGNIILLNLSMSEMKNDKNQIIGLVVTAKDITEKKKLEMELLKKNEMLGKLAITDSLTGLYNTRHFHEQIKKEMSRLKRNPDRKLSVVMLDIDHFKQLNDNEGHQMGDHVLRSLGQVIRLCIRNDVDTAFRYGGDEFIILLPDTDKNQAKVAAERIQNQFADFKFGKTSLSVGIAEALSKEAENALIKRADQAMYRSKREGRARISLS